MELVDTWGCHAVRWREVSWLGNFLISDTSHDYWLFSQVYDPFDAGECIVIARGFRPAFVRGFYDSSSTTGTGRGRDVRFRHL